MHFSFVSAAVSIICLSVGCNGQFKILGLLDTKSEVTHNGQVENVENIRAIGDVLDQFPADSDAVKSNDLEMVKIAESDEDEKENLNFIKPYEPSATTEWKSDFIEAIAVQNTTTNDVLISDKTSGENTSDGIAGASETISESNVTATSESSTASSTTSTTKAYRAYRKPNIRKFNYIEARSYHHPDSPNQHVTPSTRWNNHFVKVLKYRNKYKSKCRCERIWNCPKIQITIQRCEPDYFMCCF